MIFYHYKVLFNHKGLKEGTKFTKSNPYNLNSFCPLL